MIARVVVVMLLVGRALVVGVSIGLAEAPRDSAERGVIIDQSRRLLFRPLDVFFLVRFDDNDQYVRVPAVLFNAPEAKNQPDGAVALHAAGARIVPPEGVSSVSFHAVFLGAGGKLEFLPRETIVLDEAGIQANTNDAVREKLLQRKAELGSWRMQSQAQEESLKRLRADAEVIGDFGRILDKKEDLEKTRGDIASVQGDIENLRRFLKLAKGRTAPINQVGREAQLVGQLSEITQVSSTAEMSEVRRRAGAEAELQRKLALIEATRSEDLPALTTELARLRAALGEDSAAAAEPMEVR
jgi:hypothetical protein